MEMLGILFGMVLFPAAIAIWLIISARNRTLKRLRYAGIAVILLPAAVAGLSMAHWMFVDEPLYMAAANGNVGRVESLLRLGGDPNVEFEGYPALEQAAANGHTKVVRILLAHGARVDVRNTWDDHTPLMSATEKGYWDIVKMLKKSGAKE